MSTPKPVADDVIETITTKLRLEIYGALQHPHDQIREAAWKILDEIRAVEPLLRGPKPVDRGKKR